MILRRLTLPLVFLFCVSAAMSAHACTVCDSLTAHKVRAGIFNEHFLQTLLLVTCPLPLFAAAVGLLHFAMPDISERGIRASAVPVATRKAPSPRAAELRP